MLICKNCNKQYNQSLKFCPTCGLELIEKEEIVVENLNNEKECEKCGSTIVDGAKFCLQCGNSLNNQETHAHSEEVQSHEVTKSFSWKERLQEDLTCAFRSNKFLDFFWKYATIFALYYPIYLVISSVGEFSGLVESLDYISTFAFYTYCMGLIALFSKRNYSMMLIALAIRLLNSFIRVFQTVTPVYSICRIIVLVPVLVFLIKEFQTTGQSQNFKDCFNTRLCSVCGGAVKGNDKFFPKCERKIGEGRIL